MNIIYANYLRQTAYIKGLHGVGWLTKVRLNLPTITPQSLLQGLGLELSTYDLLG